MSCHFISSTTSLRLPKSGTTVGQLNDTQQNVVRARRWAVLPRPAARPRRGRLLPRQGNVFKLI